MGSPAIAGSVADDQGQFTVTAGGQDIWGSADQFHFVYQQITGDVDVVARIDSVNDDDRCVGQGRRDDPQFVGRQRRARVCAGVGRPGRGVSASHRGWRVP